MPPAPPAAADPPGRPAADPLLALADRCVQCGLCLPHCPTYRLDRTETEGPRGRIALARALADGSLEATMAADAHLDHCLGCRRCEAACPAGVSYGELLVEVRHRQRERRGASLRQRAIERLAANPAVLDGLLGAYRALYPVLPKRLPRPPRSLRIAPAAGPRAAGTVALFTGCVARRYDAPVHAALAALCRAAGFEVSIPASQTCCGALHAHAGDTRAAQALARANREAFPAGVTVLGSASGCHEHVARALEGQAPVRDAFAFLLQHADGLRFASAGVRVALHVPCTQRAVVGSDRPMHALLARIPGLEVVELPDTGCCGAAGMHMIDFPGRARALRQPLLDAFAASGASMLLSANIGCRLHLMMGEPTIRVRHPLEILAEHLA